MKIKKLFDAYKQLMNETPDAEAAFTASGMVNEYNKLHYGFFPLGTGVLTDKSNIEEAEIKECNILVLGNDFGTKDYLDTKCKDNKERKTNSTIRNLTKGELFQLDLNTTFFTNLYLGVRRKGTNTKRVNELKDAYKSLCYKFLKIQLNFLNPKVVLCLGAEVSQSLSDFSKHFSDFSLKNYMIDSVEDILGVRKFVVIPHPSYAHINWKAEEVRQKLRAAVLF